MAACQNIMAAADVIISVLLLLQSCSLKPLHLLLITTPSTSITDSYYWTFKEFEGQGIASFAWKELIKISQTADPKVAITAKTAPEHNASTKILENNKFIFTEIVQDEEIGDAWLWTLNPEEKTTNR